MKSLLTLFLLLSFCLWSTGCAQPEDDPPNNNALVVGMPLDNPPFEMKDSEGNPTGVCADMARDLGVYLNREINIRAVSREDLISELRDERIDLVLSPLPVNESPPGGVRLTDPYVWIGLALLTGADSGITVVEDLNTTGRVVAVLQSSPGHVYAQTALPHPEVRVHLEQSEAVRAVMEGEADAFLFDQISIYQLARRHPDTLRAVLAPLRRDPHAAAVRLGDEALAEALNDFLHDYRELNQFDALTERYFATMHKTFENMEYPFLFDKPTED